MNCSTRSSRLSPQWGERSPAALVAPAGLNSVKRALAMHRLDCRKLILAGAAAAFFRSPAQAATYPDRPIRVIIPYSPGGVGDAIMRLLSPRIENTLGQKLVIESKPGAAGNIGTLEVARAAPDGYTLLVAAANNFVINQFLMKMPVDPLSALTPIGEVRQVPLVLFSNPSVPARNLAEFIGHVRANPGKVSYGSPSNGTVNHLFIERLKQATGSISPMFLIAARLRPCWRCSPTRSNCFPLALRRRWSSSGWQAHCTGCCDGETAADTAGGADCY